MSTYDQGALVRCSAVFTDSTGVSVDPGVVTFKLAGPNSLSVTYVYLTDGALVRDSLGHYHVDVSIGITGTTSSGQYTYRFAGTVTNQAAVEGTFTVRNSGIYG